MHLFEYTDYRVWLKDRTEEMKKEKSFFSYRYIAGKLGVNAGLIARIFNGQAHLALKHVNAVASLFSLVGPELEYFEELVHFCRAKRSSDWEKHFNRMQCIRGEAFRTVADDQTEYYASWRHNAMRTLLSIYPFDGRNFRKLGSMTIPPVSAAEAEESVALLESLGLIHRGEDGIYEVPDKFISTGENWKAVLIQTFQKEMVQRSVEAIESVPRDLRDISSLTLPLSEKSIGLLRDRIREFRQELLVISRDCETEDSVFQVNIQLFPLARTRNAKAGGSR